MGAALFLQYHIMGQNGSGWPGSSSLQKDLDAEREERICEAHIAGERTVLPCYQRYWESLHHSIWADINITSFFLLQQRIREALTEATDGLGSHRLHKYLEVYTSQTRSQIGSEAKAVLWGKKMKKKNCSLVFNLSSSWGVNKYFVSDSMMSAVTQTPNLIRRLSDSALSGLKATQAWQWGNEVCLCLHCSRCSALVAAVSYFKTEALHFWISQSPDPQYSTHFPFSPPSGQTSQIKWLQTS